MISIIIPTLNEEGYIGRLLGSIYSQTYREFEVIVVDGNSKDRTQEIVRSLKKKHRNLRLLVSDKKSKGFDSNIAAKAAKYERLLFLDADDELQPEFLEKTNKEIKDRKLDLATCYVEPMSVKLIDKFAIMMLNIYIFATKSFKPQAPGYCIFSTKTLHKKIKGFDPDIKVAEDWDYSQRAGKFCRFGILRSIRIRYSMRRFEEESRPRLFMKYFVMGMYRFIFGEIKTDIFSYKLGEHH